MSGFLETIVTHVKGVVAQSKATVSMADMRRTAEAPRVVRPFRKALEAKPVAVIAEVKRASPSKGDIALDLDAAKTARRYEEGGAAALSVLTEGKFFKGSLEDLKAARKAITLPVLRKEFIVDPYQLYETAAAGADAVLLIARILEPSQLGDFMALASELRLEALVEVFDEADIHKVAPFAPPLVGINNRNLTSFDTDTTRAGRLSEYLPSGTTVVAASGIKDTEDIRRHLKAGISSFLVGESLVRAEDSVGLLRSWCNVKDEG
ncbi:indole-3-glycerol phosphate synthase TrpC [Desulfoluna spongiiphila]|uniref:indole-3-glycerol phosphate synthase TrpC n=1 Tax=Desulfoluna spongiiphila TaxID=419481 RepID=UPI00125B1AD6|nr:indole-3-glycerol phosphate synthase TrpC [Desulfoluna spongiiphila]VVS91301.1 aldolase-type tim barrel [Desulfoluna spongiiphila]